MKRRFRIFVRISVVASTMLLLLTLIFFFRSQWIADQWTRAVVTETSDDLVLHQTIVATSGWSIALRREREYFSLKPRRDQNRPRPFPIADPDPKTLREDFPVGEYFEHATYDHAQSSDFPASFGFLGFFWERQLNEPPTKVNFGNVAEAGTKYGRIIQVNGHVHWGKYDHAVLAVPWWFLLLCFGSLPAGALTRRYCRPKPIPILAKAPLIPAPPQSPPSDPLSPHTDSAQ